MDNETIEHADAIYALAVEIGKDTIRLEVVYWMQRHASELSLEAMQELSAMVGLKS